MHARVHTGYYFIYKEHWHLVFSKKQIYLDRNCQGKAAEQKSAERLATKNLKFPPEEE